jgi:hypothetical protein
MSSLYDLKQVLFSGLSARTCLQRNQGGQGEDPDAKRKAEKNRTVINCFVVFFSVFLLYHYNLNIFSKETFGLPEYDVFPSLFLSTSSLDFHLCLLIFHVSEFFDVVILPRNFVAL